MGMEEAGFHQALKKPELSYGIETWRNVSHLTQAPVACSRVYVVAKS